jgi:hypothetical protein
MGLWYIIANYLFFKQKNAISVALRCVGARERVFFFIKTHPCFVSFSEMFPSKKKIETVYT